MGKTRIRKRKSCGSAGNRGEPTPIGQDRKEKTGPYGGKDRRRHREGSVRVREKTARQRSKGCRCFQRGNGRGRHWNHEGKRHSRPGKTMGNKEAQTQIEKDCSGGRLYRPLAPSLRHVLGTKSRPNGLRSTDRIQQTDSEDWRQRSRRHTEGRIPALRTHQDRIHTLERNDTGTSKQAGCPKDPSKRTSVRRAAKDGNDQPRIKAGSIEP